MKKVLVVDNDEFILRYMEETLTKEGHQVITTKDGLSALDVLKRETPDVIFIDLIMPNIGGKKLCNIIRGMENLKDAYIIILSAVAMEEGADIVGSCADACIAKKSFDEMTRDILDAMSKIDAVPLQNTSGESAGLMRMRPRQITRELLSIKRQFEIILERMSEGILEITNSGRIIYCNPAALSLINMPEEKLLASTFVEIFSKENRTRVGELLSSMKLKAETITDASPVNLYGHQVSLDIIPINGDFSSAIVIINDVTERIRAREEQKRARDELEEQVKERTLELVKLNEELKQEINERKQAEERLRESKERYENIVESIEEGYFEVDVSGNFIFFNKAQCEMLGYSKDELPGMNNRQYMDKKNSEKFYRTFRSVYKTGKPTKIFDCELIRKDGSRFYADTSVSLIKDSKGGPTGFRGVSRDISERKSIEKQKKRLEAKTQRTDRMEALGTLAGGIAHDFNNLLMGIQGRTSLMLLDKDSSNSDFMHLKEIEKYVLSASDLTKQLLGFARGGKFEIKATDLNLLLKKGSEMFGRTKKEIKIHTKYQKDIWSVEIDPGQMEQAMLNIFVNAWQAMPGGGDLYLETENVIFEGGHDKPAEAGPGRYVKISIKDTGVGMDESTRLKIFDPFFTTKEMGRGTGLGLASVYGIVMSHQGFIDVTSKKGDGTSFTIYLHASEKDVPGGDGVREEMVRGAETVLIVDDEEMITDVGRQLLEKLGYQVLMAGSGKQAIEIYEANRNDIDLVILDMIMPDMGGGKVYDRLKAINPEIKVVLASGYSLDGQAQEILDRGCNSFIQKPFNMKKLSHKIREVLEV